jgi:hypothetical protein
MNDNLSTPNPPEGTLLFEAGKKRALLLSLALIGAVLWPLQQNWRKDPKDNFPLSYYPMFSARREAVETFYYVLGRDEQGKRYQIPYKMIGDGGGNQVRRQLRKIMNEGRAPELAKSVAKKVARSESSRWSKIVTVEVCRGKYAVDDFFRGRKEPVSETIKGSAPVERRNS